MMEVRVVLGQQSTACTILSLSTHIAVLNSVLLGHCFVGGKLTKIPSS